jgi:hypothetical protein
MSARLGRLMLATIIGVVLAVVLPLAAFADGLVTVDCGDGSPLTTSADVTMLSSIQASIQGIIDNPSGMNCSLSQDALATPTLTLGSSGSGSPYVVGGGRYSRGFGPGPMQGCGVSFGISAHQDATGYFGSQSFTVNNADGCESYEFNGHIKANVICLDVSGNVAQIKGTVTQSTGYYTTALPVGTLIETDVVDNGNPSSGVPDTIDTPQPTDAICVAGTDPYLPFTLDNGNITVHD